MLAEISPTALEPAACADHIDRLFRAARALCGSREDAEDLVQETYARVLSRPRMLRGDGELPYLLTALHHNYCSHLRTRSRRPVSVALPEDDILVERRAELEPGPALESTEVLDVIASLPAELRDVLVAVDVAGLRYREAARVLGIKQGTVMSRLFRARERVVRAIS